MQTFLPFSDYAKSAKSLDRQRLGKQRVENLQIMKALLGGKGWSNHPAVKMWRGHELELVKYNDAICDEWTSRGYKDTCKQKVRDLAAGVTGSKPSWIGNPEFHLAHQSNLIRKDAEFYSQQFPGVPGDLPYVWPL